MTLACLALLLALTVRQAPAQELYRDLRGAALDERLFEPFGAEARERIRSEPEGLRITLAKEHKATNPVGLRLAFPIKGDFEITIGYELLHRDPPTGHGVGLELYAVTDTATAEAVRLARVARIAEGEVYMCSRMTTTPEGKRQSRHRYLDTTCTSGHLRLTRKGRDVSFSASEEDGVFHLLHFSELGAEDLRRVSVAAYPGLAVNAVDLRLRDIRIRTGSLPDVPQEETSAPARWRWKAWLAAAISLLAAALAFTVYGKLRNRTSPPAG